MKQTSGALSMLLASYRSILSAAFVKGCAAACVLTAATSGMAQAESLSFEGTNGVQTWLSQNEKQLDNFSNEISMSELYKDKLVGNMDINLSGDINLSNANWSSAGTGTGGDNFTSVVGFVAVGYDTNGEDSPDYLKGDISIRGGHINVADGTKLTGLTYDFSKGEDEGKGRAGLIGAALWDSGNGSNNLYITDAVINIGSNATISDFQLDGSKLNMDSSPTKPVNGSIKGSVNFADSTADKKSTIKDSYVRGAFATEDQNEGYEHIQASMDVEGNIYLGKNVEFQGNDFTSTEDELNRDALVGALNAIGGSVDGSVAINGKVTNAQVIGAEGRDSDVYGSVIIGQDGAVIMENTDYVMNTDAVSSALAAQEDSEEPAATQQTFKRNMQLSAASASGKTGEVEANVEIYGQYGDASSNNKNANAPINVISAETFESAKARVVINQSEEVAKKSNIDTVNVVRIQKINTDAKFTEGNSSNATATASVDVGGYSKVNELNVLSIAQGDYYGTFDVTINVGENAEVSTINAVKLDGDGSFKGEGTISQTMNIAGKVNTINYFVTGDSSFDDETTDQPVQSESTPKAVAYSIMPAAFAAPAPKAEDSTETPAAPTYKFTVKLEGNASLDKIVGKDGIESITDIHASGNVTLGSIEKSQVGTLLIDASTSDLSKASFTYKGNDNLKADVVQVVTGGRNVEKAFESTNNKEIITNEMRAGDKATVYKAYTKNDKSSFSMGTNFSANGTEVMLGDNTMLSDMEGMTSYMAVDQDNAKSLSEAAAGTAALLTQGSEFVAGQGLDAASAAVARANGGASAFGAVQAGYNEYDTGSSVDLTSVTGLVGFAKGFKFGDDLLTAAVFLDLGYGSSDIHAGSNDTDGKHTYYGIGAGLRYDLSNGLFVDGTMRGGRADTEFDGDINGLKDDYDADAGYFGASLGLGYRYAVNDALSLTPYACYTFTYLGSDSVTTDSGEKLKLDSITAHGLQAGLDLDYAMTDLLTFTAGAGYLGVYNGDADAKVEGLGIDSPSVEGNSGFIKAGLRIAPQGTGFSCDLSAQGYAGDRQGGMGSVMVNYAF